MKRTPLTPTCLSSGVRAPEFVLPASFRPVDFLSGRLALRGDDARWLISTILRKTANQKTDLWGVVRLHSDILRRIMDKHHYAAIVKALEAGGAIETAKHAAGVKAKGFRLALRFLGEKHVRIPATDPRLIERIERERQRRKSEEQKTRWKPVHFQLAAEQRCVTIDDSADAILDSLPDHTRLCQDVLVGNIRRGQHSFTVGTTGRVFNSITGLKRELRKALRIDGKPVGSVDIVCCQPALLAFLISQQSHGQYPPNDRKSRATYKYAAPPASVVPLWWSPGAGPSPCPSLAPAAGPSVGPVPCFSAPTKSQKADFDKFAEAVAGGSFYDLLCDLSGLDRDRVKLGFLRDVLAKKGRYPSEVEDVFRAAFPSVHKFIRAVNRHDHGELIRLLQRTESWLVVERVAPRLLERGARTATLHDAIFSAKDSLGEVEAAFRDALAEIGFSLSWKKENHE